MQQGWAQIIENGAEACGFAVVMWIFHSIARWVKSIDTRLRNLEDAANVRHPD